MKRITFWGAVIGLAVWILTLAVMGISIFNGMDTVVIQVGSYIMFGCMVVVAPCLLYRAWLKQLEYAESLKVENKRPRQDQGDRK